MKASLFLKKSVRYISCAVKYAAAAVTAPFLKKRYSHEGLWIIAERGIDARDNAYYLYKYITENHPEINIAYIIDSSSPDRARVEGMGKIIDYGSFEHYVSMFTSDVKISTHIMGYTPFIDFFVRADKWGLVRGKKIFLQHGITKDNLTYLYSSNVRLDLFVCSAAPELEYVREKFGYDADRARMLGFCRYDALYKNENKTRKVLLMPTWRYYLGGADKKMFSQSEYFRVYDRLLKSERLASVLEKYDYELLFYPHIEMQRFIDCFTGRERVKIISFKDSTVQNLLINSDVLITDFSSVFFDYAYMGKPMLFYQFDEESFRKQHYGEGYFSYKNDGFGDVVYDENSLIDALDAVLARGAVLEDKYRGRINAFFTLRDRNNCERNFDAIKEISERN